MAGGIGTFGVLGYAIETVVGTFVAPSLSIPITDETLKFDSALISPDSIAGTRDRRRYALRGKAKISGDVKFDLFTDAGSLLVASCLAAAPAAGTVNPTNALSTFSIQVDKADVTGLRFTGMMPSKLNIVAKAGETIKATISYMGLNEVSGAVQTTPTYATTDPLNWDNVAVSTGAYGAAAADVDVTDFEFTLENANVEFYGLNQTNLPARIIAGPRKVEGKFTKFFANTTLHAAYLANTKQSLAIAILDAAAKGYTFTFPRVNIQAWGAPMKIADIIVQEIAFWAPLDAATNRSIQLLVATTGGTLV